MPGRRLFGFRSLAFAALAARPVAFAFSLRGIGANGSLTRRLACGGSGAFRPWRPGWPVWTFRPFGLAGLAGLTKLAGLATAFTAGRALLPVRSIRTLGAIGFFCPL